MYRCFILVDFFVSLKKLLTLTSRNSLSLKLINLRGGMIYTVSQLARISGATVRALHWYDKKEILKPAYYGVNNYRYYRKEQLRRLQQILFFKSLGYNLSDIKKLLTQDNTYKIKELEARKRALVKDIAIKKNIINIIDKTILHLTVTIPQSTKT